MLLGGRTWNATPAEAAAEMPCDAYLDPPFERLTRAVDAEASADVTFRWVCQLKVAPYSYDWIDNRGRQSPRELTAGAGELVAGQRFAEVFEIVELEPGRSITAVALPGPARVFGPVATTYAVEGRGELASRIVVRLDVAAPKLRHRLARPALAWGDLVMMRRQLLNLAALAARDSAST